MHNHLLVLTNVPDQATAQSIAHELVSRRLAACVNIFPGVQSIYQWQGKIECASELTLFIKTQAVRYAEVEQAVQALHPYDTPEVIALPIATGLEKYLQWIDDETRKDVHA